MINVQCFAAELPAPGARPTAPVRLALAERILDYSQQELARLSAGRREALVLWAGRPTVGDGAFISHVITLDTNSGRRWLNVPSQVRAQLALTLRREQLLTFADIHTHPAQAFLSAADQKHPFSSRPGFYAIVVPDFACGPPAAGWRAYQSTGRGWQEVICRDRFTPWPE